MTWKLGDEFSVQRGNDTLNIQVKFDKANRYNYLIQKQTNDTIFAGTVSRYRGLYYFSRQVDDTTHWIHAMEIGNGAIKGLKSEWIQMLALDSEFDDLLTDQNKTENFKSPILKYVDHEKEIIRLTPDKKAMREFYESIIDSLPADTLIHLKEPTLNTEIEEESATTVLNTTDKEQLEIIDKIYPNPADQNVTLALKDKGIFRYSIFDNNGKLAIKGQLSKSINNIDISELKSGTYFFKVYPADREQVETIKLIKK